MQLVTSWIRASMAHRFGDIIHNVEPGRNNWVGATLTTRSQLARSRHTTGVWIGPRGSVGNPDRNVHERPGEHLHRVITVQ